MRPLRATEPLSRRALRHASPVGARAATAARVDESLDSTAVQNWLRMRSWSVLSRPIVLAALGAGSGAATAEGQLEYVLDGPALSKVCVRAVV